MDRHTDTQAETNRDREIDRETERDMQRGRQRNRERERQREREAKRGRERERVARLVVSRGRVVEAVPDGRDRVRREGGEIPASAGETQQSRFERIGRARARRRPRASLRDARRFIVWTTSRISLSFSPFFFQSKK